MGLKLALKKKKTAKLAGNSRCVTALLFKQHDAGGKAVDKVLATDRSQLSGGEEASQRNRPHFLTNGPGVVVGFTKQLGSSPIASE